ncbi:MAG: alpha/beta fold hydrolase [Chloroflexi bacterium]|nr:alpha/beta fold hydrolase [Chloroflexota bacterium]MBI3338864.1 alpha/beta fold hydrolase [Chloroflexota bacterium]
MPFPYRDETKELNDAVRASLPDAFVRLADGVTHYELGGPESGQPVVLVHGFSVPYFIWDPTFAALTSAGFRVLRYDLYGRGLSDRPRTSYDMDLFVRQLHDLLDAHHLQQVNIIGLSMGGAIASAFTVRFPERVRRLALIDPVGKQGMPLSWLYKAAFLPGISELILGLAGTEKMVKGIASDFFVPEHITIFQDKYRAQMQYRGFKRAILSTLRNKMVGGHANIYDQLGKLSKPVLLLWGRNDGTLPFDHSQDIIAAVPGIEFHPIENSGHIPHFEKPEIVNPILINFLIKNDAKTPAFL